MRESDVVISGVLTCMPKIHRLSRFAPSNLADNAHKLCPAIIRIITLDLDQSPATRRELKRDDKRPDLFTEPYDLQHNERGGKLTEDYIIRVILHHNTTKTSGIYLWTT
jgi:hypothetical protein